MHKKRVKLRSIKKRVKGRGETGFAPVNPRRVVKPDPSDKFDKDAFRLGLLKEKEQREREAKRKELKSGWRGPERVWGMITNPLNWIS